MIYVYAGHWPYERTAWLRNVGNLTYSQELMHYGQFRFSLPTNDTQGVVLGDLVGITSSYGLPDFLGVVERIRESYDAVVSIEGRGIESILAERLTAQERTYPLAAGGDIAREIMRRAAGKNQTGITVLSTGGSTPIISPFVSRSDTVLAALSTLADLTSWEWEVIVNLGVTAVAQFVWRQRVGWDRTRTVHLAGKMITDADLDTDVLSERKVLQLVASSGQYANRPSVVSSVDAPLALQDVANVRVPLNPAPSRRTKSRPSIATSREAAVLDAQLPDAISAQKQVSQLLLAARGSAETLSLVVNTNVDWTDCRVGNTVTVRLAGFAFGADVVRPFRIYGVQADEGELSLVGKVLPDAA